MTWHVLAVHPPAFDRWCEFDVRDDLHKLGARALVPVEFRLRKGSKFPKRRPVVGGYVFASFDSEPPWSVMRLIRGYRGPIEIGGRYATISQREADAIEMLSVPMAAIPTTGKHRLGDKVRIRRGHLATLSAVVERLERGRVVVSTEMFGKAFSVPLNESDVEAA